MSTALFPIGTSVLAKWPTTNNYYQARIVDYTDENGYVCEFLDGSMIALQTKYVDLPDKFRRRTKGNDFIQSESVSLDRSMSFYSMFVSFIWITIFISVQHSFHQNPDVDNSNGSRIHTPLQQYPIVVIQYSLLWFCLQFVCARYLPHIGGKQLVYTKESHPHTRYEHRSNSLLAFIATCLLMYIFREKIPLRELTKSYYLLGLCSLGIALILSLSLLINRLLVHHRDKGTKFDFHLFLSIRPGLLLWPALNFLLLLTIFKYNHRISIRFALSILLQTIYIVNVFVHETSMLRQSLDLSHPSSFDTLFTNLCWVPFMATLTSFHIGKSHRPVHPLMLILAIVLFAVGYWLQHTAMNQRTTFRALNGSSVIDTDSQCILTSGCWQWCRNPHLLAEILMAIAWSLPAGVHHLTPWLYAFYITGMAVYKAHFFDRILRRTYTRDAYESYTKHVRYILIPFIY